MNPTSDMDMRIYNLIYALYRREFGDEPLYEDMNGDMSMLALEMMEALTEA